VTTTPIHQLLVAIEAIQAAAIATESVRHASAGGTLSALIKGDASPVTVADFASQAVVLSILQSAFGHVPLLGEESDGLLRDPANAAILDAVVAAARTAIPELDHRTVLDLLAHERADPSKDGCWTLDPVDGTKGFLRGGQYAIALAWIEEGRPHIGAMACPRLALDLDDPSQPAATGLVAFALRGGGARWMSLGSDEFESAEPLSAPAWRLGEPVELLLSAESAHGDGDAAGELGLRAGPLGRALRLDSASKYVLLAHGRGNAYMRVPRISPGKPERKECVWDHAAGVLIAEEAGCVTSDLDGRPLDFAAGPTLAYNRGLLAGPPALVRAIAPSAGPA
jgi:3'(2'), 5'-bisphosphate nucleotidase